MLHVIVCTSPPCESNMCPIMSFSGRNVTVLLCAASCICRRSGAQIGDHMQASRETEVGKRKREVWWRGWGECGHTKCWPALDADTAYTCTCAQTHARF